VPNLGRAVAMLREGESQSHSADGKGTKVVSYLEELATHMAGEQQALLGEVEALGASVEHIKEIVAMQQGYARATGGVQETLRTSALVADALRMNGEPRSGGRVEVATEIAVDPEITVEKHKVLQILVNLISNAKNAMEEMQDAPHRLTLRVDIAAGSRLRIQVKDEGEGIPAQNLTRIFAHGFTTRKSGHGFGLHSCALAAKQMGGTLSAHSDGPGRGATFTLELPIDTAGSTK